MDPSARSAQTSGVLVDADDMGVLLSAEDPTDGPIRVFVPWTSIAWIRAMGMYEPPLRGNVRSLGRQASSVYPPSWTWTATELPSRRPPAVSESPRVRSVSALP
jgi:hypothetical protein